MWYMILTPDPLTAKPVAKARFFTNHCDGKVMDGEKTHALPRPKRIP